MALASVLLFISCGTSKINLNQATLNDNHFTGLLVIDPATNDTLVNHNSNKYFTPASNVKIFTLYSGLKLLPQQLPSLKYFEQNDTLFVEGTGNPTVLHPDFETQNDLNFLRQHKNIVLFLDNYSGDKYGPGWAWEDYDTYFSPEVGPLPLYGNVVTAIQTDSLKIIPEHFTENVFQGKRNKLREEATNIFYLPITTDTLYIPFVTSKSLTEVLLEKATGTSVSLIDSMPEHHKTTLFGMKADVLYKNMMQESDNFLAEQIMIMASSQLSDTLNFATAKTHMIKNHLSDLKQEPRWVDGSGLSRYNLFTPNSFVYVLHRLYNEFPKERLFYLFPSWDQNGTLEPFETGNSFIIAKSGALGNNYNLSGYLITKSGKVLIFSFMNNHFRVPTKNIRAFMKRTLQELHENN